MLALALTPPFLGGRNTWNVFTEQCEALKWLAFQIFFTTSSRVRHESFPNERRPKTEYLVHDIRTVARFRDTINEAW